VFNPTRGYYIDFNTIRNELRKVSGTSILYPKRLFKLQLEFLVITYKLKIFLVNATI